MLRLKRLKLIQFRNVAPDTELHFNDGFNILLGMNASGKTTLLKLIEACVRGDFSPYHDEELAIEFDISMKNILFQVILKHKENLKNKLNNLNHYYREDFFLEGIFTINHLDDGKNIQLGKMLILGDLGKNIWHQVSNQDGESKYSPEYFYLMSFLNENCTRFDEALNFYEIITNAKINFSKSPLIQIQNAEDEGRIFYRLIPKDMHDELKSNLIQRVERAEDARYPFVVDFLDFNSMSLIRETMRVSSIYCEFREYFGSHLNNKKASMKSTWIISEFHFRFGSIGQDHDILSFGQKRLFSFVYYAACNPEIIIADELVNGLHHQWIDACMELIKDRQCFLTSQNPLLLDCLEFNSVDEVQKTFVQCKREEDAEGEPRMVWSNMEIQDAQIFYDAYLRGFQHISEILITRGLW